MIELRLRSSLQDRHPGDRRNSSQSASFGCELRHVRDLSDKSTRDRFGRGWICAPVPGIGFESDSAVAARGQCDCAGTANAVRPCPPSI